MKCARCIVYTTILMFLVAGCSGDSGPSVKLAPARGVVTYKGAPLAGANVTFLPEKGPLAMASTDLEGKFTLKSGAMAGCAVGKAKVAISMPGDSGSNSSFTPSGDPLANSKSMAEATMSHQKAQAAKPKSLIPDRYKEVATSNLEFPVDSDGSKNDFKIELKD